MPFKSEDQRKFMFAKHPKIAERWTKKYGSKPNKSKKRGHKSMEGLKRVKP